MKLVCKLALALTLTESCWSKECALIVVITTDFDSGYEEWASWISQCRIVSGW